MSKKPSEKQLHYIKIIEKASHVPFNGRTMQDACEYIRVYKKFVRRTEPDYEEIGNTYCEGWFC